MKFYNLSLACLMLFFAKTSMGQNSQNKWTIGIGIHAVDHTAVRPILSGPFDFNDWSFQPPISRIWVARNIHKRLNVVADVVAGSIDNYRFGVEDEFFLDASIGLQFRIGNDKRFFKVFDPYIVGSVGYHLYDYRGIPLGGNEFQILRENGNSSDIRRSTILGDNNSFLSAGIGVGFNIWITEKFGINYQLDYKHMPFFGDSDYQDFINHKAGIIFRFGVKDTDNDGVYDNKDDCPQVAGLEEFNGCPDSDGDKIIDSKDDCPQSLGLAKFNGCPDTDGDGIKDTSDLCPRERGNIKNNGCPDSDRDGFIDKNDRCPRQWGVAPDGCPKITTTEIGEITDIARTIYFKTGKSEIANKSKNKLRQVAAIIGKYPKTKFAINGYTDSVGRELTNLKLSDKRANVVRNYLIGLGVKERQLTAKGYGESNPIASNKTKEGRSQNRRTEIKLIR